MKRTTCILLAFIGVVLGINAQRTEQILQEIEQNNTVLSALKKQAEAEKTANKTGIYLENPEVEYHYLWGNSAEMGDRTDFNISQRLDFPTSYFHKKKVSEEKNLQVDLKYRTERKAVLLEAWQICIRLIGQNLLAGEYRRRLDHAEKIANAYQTKFDRGEANVFDNNKAKLNLLNAQNELAAVEVEQKQLQADLSRLNGNKELSFPLTTFEPALLPPDFEQWYAERRSDNATLRYLEQEIVINKQQEKLQRSMNLPKLSVGYMSEKILNEHLQGVAIGISIPLWGNKNTVKQLKAQTIASEAVVQDVQSRFYNQCKTGYEKAGRLQGVLKTNKESLSKIGSGDLLKKALDSGEISLIDYINELRIYYDAVNYQLKTEQEYQLLVAELRAWEW